MTTVNKLGWRNFVSGVLAVLVGLIPVFIYCLSVGSTSPYLGSTLVTVIALGLGFGIIIGTPLELFVVHRFTKAAVVKTVVAYLVVGAAIDLAVNLYFTVPSVLRQPSTFSPYLTIAIFMMIFIVYAVVAVTARLIYPLIHRVLWRVPVPYGSPVVVAAETSTDY